MNKYKNKNDKTEKNIMNTTLTLMQSYEFSNITMNQIAENAKLNRVTLYRHFDDKWDILERIEKDFFQAAEAPHQKMIEQLKNASEDYQDARSVLAEFLEIFANNLDILEVLMNDNGDSKFTSKLLNFLLKREKLSHPVLGINDLGVNQEMLSYYEISGLVGIIKFWTKHRQYKAKDMVDFFFAVRTNEVKGIKQLK